MGKINFMVMQSAAKKLSYLFDAGACSWRFFLWFALERAVAAAAFSAFAFAFAAVAASLAAVVAAALALQGRKNKPKEGVNKYAGWSTA